MKKLFTNSTLLVYLFQILVCHWGLEILWNDDHGKSKTKVNLAPSSRHACCSSSKLPFSWLSFRRLSFHNEAVRPFFVLRGSFVASFRIAGQTNAVKANMRARWLWFLSPSQIECDNAHFNLPIVCHNRLIAYQLDILQIPRFWLIGYRKRIHLSLCSELRAECLHANLTCSAVTRISLTLTALSAFRAF